MNFNECDNKKIIEKWIDINKMNQEKTNDRQQFISKNL